MLLLLLLFFLHESSDCFLRLWAWFSQNKCDVRSQRPRPPAEPLRDKYLHKVELFMTNGGRNLYYYKLIFVDLGSIYVQLTWFERAYGLLGIIQQCVLKIYCLVCQLIF